MNKRSIKPGTVTIKFSDELTVSDKDKDGVLYDEFDLPVGVFDYRTGRSFINCDYITIEFIFNCEYKD